MEGKCFDAFVEVSAVFPCQGKISWDLDLMGHTAVSWLFWQMLPPRDTDTEASATAHRLCRWPIEESLPTPQFPALSCQVTAPCSQTSDVILREAHISPSAVLYQWCRRWKVRSDGMGEEADEDFKYCLHFPRINKSQSYFLWMWRSPRDQFGPLRNHFTILYLIKLEKLKTYDVVLSADSDDVLHRKSGFSVGLWRIFCRGSG